MITYSPISASDLEEAVSLSSLAFGDEPMSVHLQLPVEHSIKYHNRCKDLVLLDSSFVAKDSSTGVIVGTRLVIDETAQMDLSGLYCPEVCKSLTLAYPLR
eukprot:TRINITY_DN7191_c0_g2_i1.p1 TRINITY_DN7191_c0_g2~~TRINITY_DN7191_c0_g2_i1.p1  ORF type:complete len:101 (+),score=6.70 TRINITY_DN7191_c0_g2_i1:130-432(+)